VHCTAAATVSRDEMVPVQRSRTGDANNAGVRESREITVVVENMVNKRDGFVRILQVVGPA
jgi:hypothetical protein